MIVALLLLSTAPGPIEPGLDQIDHVRAVAEFLAEVETSDIELNGVRLENRDDASQNNAASLFEYVRACSIEKIETFAPTDSNMPLSVYWNCGRMVMKGNKPKSDIRQANFWVEDGKVVRIKFGDLQRLVIPASADGEREAN